MRTIEINTDATTLSKIVDYLNALEVKFTIKETEDEAYDPEFVEMVLKASKEQDGSRELTDAYKNELFGSL